MRCGTAQVIYAFDASGASVKTAYTVVTVGAEGAACTAADYVVVPAAEFDNAIASPFRLTLSEAGAVMTGVLVLWALGWSIRALVRVIRDTDAPPVHD